MAGAGTRQYERNPKSCSARSSMDRWREGSSHGLRDHQVALAGLDLGQRKDTKKRHKERTQRKNTKKRHKERTTRWHSLGWIWEAERRAPGGTHGAGSGTHKGNDHRSAVRGKLQDAICTIRAIHSTLLECSL